MMVIKLIALAALALLLWAVLLACLSHRAPQPEVRLMAGQLRPCPETPNCVSSESRAAAAQIAPLQFKGSAEKAWADLRWAIQAAGGTLVEEQPGFLWATYTSRIFRFVDDMEFRLVAEQGVIHLRSASRVGRSDLGVNAARAAEVRRLFALRQEMC